jgi:dipeptidyl aminopeptidase/acylaminoacyl peptidase
MAKARPDVTARAILLALSLVACESAPDTTSTAPRPVATSSPAARASASPSAEPSPLAAAVPGVRARAGGPVIDPFRYVPLESPLIDGMRTRLWLVDLSAKRAPVLVAEWDAPAAPVGGYSLSADGKTLIVSASGTRSRVALWLVRPETGEARVLFEDPDTIVLSPRVSPDGTRYAFTKYPASGGHDLGIWAGRMGSDAARITDPTSSTNVPQLPLAWSPDSAWLAFSRDLERTEVDVVPAAGGDEITIGPGDKVSWRKAAPELLVADSVAPASRIYTADIRTGKTIDLVKVDKQFIPSVQWHPAGDRFVYVVSENAGREASGGIWVRTADGSAPLRLDVGRVVFGPQWSREGTILSGLAGGDDSRIPIVDLLGGRQLSLLCRRGGTPPGDCL